jgi:Holliday junction resolvase RusA-like endonuclease
MYRRALSYKVEFVSLLLLYLFRKCSFAFVSSNNQPSLLPSSRNFSGFLAICSLSAEAESEIIKGSTSKTRKRKPGKIIKGSPSTSTTTAAKKAKKKTTKKKKKKKEKGPAHWIGESDKVLIEYGNSNSTQGVSLLHFKVRGHPRPLTRHRTSFGRVYNPSEKLQESFRQVVRELIFSKGDIQAPIFDDDESLVMTIVFRLKRPKKHFKSGKPGPGRFRADAPPQTSQTRTDVDNLIKFVLDSMNEVLYPDDRQIMSVRVTKVLDNEDMCEGSTEICLRSIEENFVDDLISNSFHLSMEDE